MLKKFKFSLSLLLDIASSPVLAVTTPNIKQNPWLVLGSHTGGASLSTGARRLATRAGAQRARRIVNSTREVRIATP